MKKLLLTLVVFLFVLALSAQDQYSRVKVYANQEQLRTLAANGLIIDNGIFKAGVYVICELSQAEIARVEAAGIRYDVMIPDVSKFYEERNKPYMSHLDEMTRMTYDLSEEWPVPEGFELGTCGGFFTIDQAMEHLDSMAAQYPDLISPRHSLPYTTANGRQLYWVRISDNPNTDEEGEPEVLYTGMHHAREAIGMQLLFYYMYYLLENYDTDPDVQYIVNNFELYFIPIVNPDGYAYNIQNQPNGGGMWRKNRRQNDDGSYGVDINRNYGYMWGYDNYGSSSDPNDETYRGTEAFSEPEIQSVRDFCEDHQFGIAINYHSYSNDLLYPWGYTSALCADDATFNAYSILLTTENGYLYGPSYTTIYPTNGSSDDWMYGEQETKNAIFAYTSEVGSGSQGFWPSVSDIIPLCQVNMFQNIKAAELAGPYAAINDVSPSIIENNSGLFFFNLERLGLESGATYTISIEPLNDAITSVSDPMTFSNLDILQTVNAAFTYTLKDNIQSGDHVDYLLSVNDGLGTFSDTIKKVYGTPVVIFQDSASNFNNWTSNKWNTTTAQYHSATTSITDSPYGQYGNGENNIITLNDPIDLDNVAYASLTYWARWDIETGYDYVQVLVSDDNGATWTPIAGKYTHPGNSNQAYGQPVYDGTQTSWVKEEISLEHFIGSQIKIRFVLRSDSFEVGDGFYFDDMAVTIVDFETGVGENAKLHNAELSVHPNPASKTATFGYNIKGSANGTALLIIFNNMGQKVSEHEIHGNAGTVNIDVSSWPAGMYFYSLDSEHQGIISSGKLIVR